MKSREQLVVWILASFASQIPEFAHAQTWTHLATRGGTTAYIDTSSIRRSDGVAQALVLSSFAEPTSVRVAGGRLRKQSITYLTSFDCATKSFLVQETIWYDAPMVTGAAHTISSRVRPQWIGPESKLYTGNLNVDALSMVCAKR